jgi:ribokinase
LRPRLTVVGSANLDLTAKVERLPRPGEFAEQALAGLRAAGVEIEVARRGDTGIALIVVAADGDNQIVVVPGANATVDAVGSGTVLSQLEIPLETVLANAEAADWFCLNAAPAKPVDVEPD